MIHGYYHHMLRWVHAYLLFDGTHYDNLLTTNMEFSNKILYKQYIDIRNQTNKNIIQKQGYLIGHLKSNVKLSLRHPQWSRHCERLGKVGCTQKRGQSSTPSLFRIMCGVAIYFLLQKISKKNTHVTYLNNTTSH